MPEIGDEILNDRNVKCKIIEHKDDYYIVETPEGSIENITDKELESLLKQN